MGQYLCNFFQCPCWPQAGFWYLRIFIVCWNSHLLRNLFILFQDPKWNVSLEYFNFFLNILISWFKTDFILSLKKKLNMIALMCYWCSYYVCFSSYLWESWFNQIIINHLPSAPLLKPLAVSRSHRLFIAILVSQICLWLNISHLNKYLECLSLLVILGKVRIHILLTHTHTLLPKSILIWFPHSPPPQFFFNLSSSGVLFLFSFF